MREGWNRRMNIFKAEQSLRWLQKLIADYRYSSKLLVKISSEYIKGY